MDATEVKAWRRLERTRLITGRMGLLPAVRRGFGERIIAALRPFLTERPGVLGAYWPFRAEFDPQPLIESLTAAGRVVALPVVVDKRGPLEYRTWRRKPNQRGVGHPDPGKARDRDTGDGPRTACRLRSQFLSAWLWRRLL